MANLLHYSRLSVAKNTSQEYAVPKILYGILKGGYIIVMDRDQATVTRLTVQLTLNLGS